MSSDSRKRLSTTISERANSCSRPSSSRHVLTGYASLEVRNRGLVAVLGADPSVATVLGARAEWGDLIKRQLALLADVDASRRVLGLRAPRRR
jgi:hypothetical protein